MGDVERASGSTTAGPDTSSRSTFRPRGLDVRRAQKRDTETQALPVMPPVRKASGARGDLDRMGWLSASET